MDLDDWEYLYDDGFTDQLQNPDGNRNGNGKRLISDPSLYQTSTIDMDYFQKLMDPPKKVEVDPVAVSPNPVVPETLSSLKKTVEDEFADMKLDSPDPQIEVGSPQFVEKEEGFECGEDGYRSDSDNKGVFGTCKEDNLEDPDEELEEDKNGGGLNMWKVGMTGLCSFGFAFATICVIALGTRHRVRHRDQNLHFQMYTHDKRLKQVVHHATKLNGAISVVRGAPLSRAHITIGGYFEGL